MVCMIEYVIKNVTDISEKDYRRCFSYMSDSRKAKVKRQKNNMSKQCTLAGEWLVRMLLCKITGKPVESYIINADENGKLYCQNAQGLFFNISHSKNTVAVAVSKKEIGIDIETIRPVWLKLAKRVCTNDELIYIFGKVPTDLDYDDNTNPQYIRRFLEIWTLKEAYLKCKGTGITGFESFCMPTDDFEKIKIENDNYIMHIVIKQK